MKWKVLLGLLFGALFVWIVAAGVSGPDEQAALLHAFATMDYAPLIPFVLLVGLYHVLRVWRWKLLLQPDYSPSFRSLFSINMVGFMAVNLLPARLGELARPFLLMQRENVPLSVGLASALIERMLDFLCMLALLAYIVYGVDLPTTSITVGGQVYPPIREVVQRVFLLAALPAVGGLIGLMLFESFMYRLLHLTIGRVLPAFAARFEAFCRSFIQALRPLRQPKTLLIQVGLTLLIWAVAPATEWLMFRVFHLDTLGLDAAMTVVGAILIGMLIPGPPGFAGNFEAFTMAGLAIFGVTGGVALGYSLMLHWLQFFQIFVMGMYYLWRDKMTFSSVFKFSSESAQAATSGSRVSPPSAAP